MEDADLAALVAETAGGVLVALDAGDLWAGADKGRIGDRLSHEVIVEALRVHRPGDAILSEEGADNSARLGQRRVWIVDPLDGTREYGEGRDDWAVQIGLAVDGRPRVGAVAIPARGALLRSDRPPALPRCPKQPRLLISRSHPPAGIGAIAEGLAAVIVPMGSVGVKVAALLVGEGEAYLHYGGQFEWDSCAPVALALAAGFDATRLSGGPLVYNRADPALPDLVISHPAVTAQVRAVLDRLAPMLPSTGPGA
jgi:3'(2'), 5'-bisphosphate nucleotidase